MKRTTNSCEESKYATKRFWPCDFRGSAKSMYWIFLYTAKFECASPWTLWSLLNYVRKSCSGRDGRWRRVC